MAANVKRRNAADLIVVDERSPMESLPYWARGDQPDRAAASRFVLAHAAA